MPINKSIKIKSLTQEGQATIITYDNDKGEEKKTRTYEKNMAQMWRKAFTDGVMINVAFEKNEKGFWNIVSASIPNQVKPEVPQAPVTPPVPAPVAKLAEQVKPLVGTPQTPQNAPQATNKPPKAESKENIAPQELGVWFKEVGECIRSGYFKAHPSGENTMLEMAYWTRMFEVLRVSTE